MSNLTPVPIVDKNGKQTTVRKRLIAPSASPKLAGATPVRPAAETASGTPLPVVHPLSSSEVQEFLAFYAPMEDAYEGAYGKRDPVVVTPTTTKGTPGVFWALSGVSKGLLWRARQSKAMSDANITLALSRCREKEQNLWDDTTASARVAETLLRSVVLVAERIHADHPDLIQQHSAGSVQRILEDAVGGHFYRGKDTEADTRELATVEEVSSIAGTAAFLLVCNATDKHEVEQCFRDSGDRLHTGLGIANRTLAEYVKTHPEQAVRAAEFVMDRNIGKSKEDAKLIIEMLSSETPALAEGHL